MGDVLGSEAYAHWAVFLLLSLVAAPECRLTTLSWGNLFSAQHSGGSFLTPGVWSFIKTIPAFM